MGQADRHSSSSGVNTAPRLHPLPSSILHSPPPPPSSSSSFILLLHLLLTDLPLCSLILALSHTHPHPMCVCVLPFFMTSNVAPTFSPMFWHVSRKLANQASLSICDQLWFDKFGNSVLLLALKTDHSADVEPFQQQSVTNFDTLESFFFL